MCQRETGAVFEAGGLQYVLSFVRTHGSVIHKDTLHSAMGVVTRLCSKMEPTDAALPPCAESLSSLLRHEDGRVAECALRCFATLADRFMRKGLDPAPLNQHGNLADQLLHALRSYGQHTPQIQPPSDPQEGIKLHFEFRKKRE